MHNKIYKQKRNRSIIPDRNNQVSELEGKDRKLSTKDN